MKTPTPALGTLLVWLSTSSLYAGCSSDSSAAAPDSATAANGGSAPDAPAGGAGGTGTAPGASPVVEVTEAIARKAGTLRGRFGLVKDYDGWAILSAFDSANGYQENGFACHLSTFEGCEVETCAFPTGSSAGTLLHPGVLTLTNETTGATATMTPLNTPGTTTRGIYGTLTDTALPLKAGDQLRLSAAGTSDVPAFETVVTIPGVLAEVAPTSEISTVAVSTIQAANGFGYTWAAAEGQAEVQYSDGPYGFSGGMSFNSTAYCVFPATSGAAGLSSALLSTTGCHTYDVTALNDYAESQVTVGSFAVTVLVEARNVSGWIDCTENN